MCFSLVTLQLLPNASISTTYDLSSSAFLNFHASEPYSSMLITTAVQPKFRRFAQTFLPQSFCIATLICITLSLISNLLFSSNDKMEPRYFKWLGTLMTHSPTTYSLAGAPTNNYLCILNFILKHYFEVSVNFLIISSISYSSNARTSWSSENNSAWKNKLLLHGIQYPSLRQTRTPPGNPFPSHLPAPYLNISLTESMKGNNPDANPYLSQKFVDPNFTLLCWLTYLDRIPIFRVQGKTPQHLK